MIPLANLTVIEFNYHSGMGKNRKSAYYSLRAKGTLENCNSGTEIELNFLKPLFPNFIELFFNRYKYDRKVILDFLKDWLKIKYVAEQQL